VDTTLQDLRLLAQFEAASALALRGDVGPLTSALGLVPWRRVTSGPFSLHTLPDGHTVVLRSPA
jgi:hypothetical protein